MDITFNSFAKFDIRVGTVVDVKVFEKARKPAYKLWVDFGKDIGVLKSSAQITELYGTSDILGKQVIAIVNFPKKQIADFMSECLVLGGVNSENSEVVLLKPEREVKNGTRIA